jgi:cytochrome c peroxidase
VLNVIDLSSNELMPAVDLNPDRTETIEERGYKIFHDAMLAFQNWQSCAGCHPGNARPDGLNWDLLNDGIGNPKNTRSLMFSHETPPVMISGVRPNAEAAVRAGFRFIQFFEVDEETASAVDAYLRSLRPVPSPFLVDGELSPLAQRGQRVFERLSCIECHSGPFFTDLQRHRVGEDIEFEDGWDTPTLREVWRTAPYLFDGRAATIEEVFTIHRHGIEDRRVSRRDIRALVEFVKSL